VEVEQAAKVWQRSLIYRLTTNGEAPADCQQPKPTVVTQWLESISGSESYRERHCRSDTLLRHSDDDLIPRRLTKSAPNMGYTQDADRFALPPTPASTWSRSFHADAEDDSQVHIASLVDHVGRAPPALFSLLFFTSVFSDYLQVDYPLQDDT
jgi:hypothetical protein